MARVIGWAVVHSEEPLNTEEDRRRYVEQTVNDLNRAVRILPKPKPRWANTVYFEVTQLSDDLKWSSEPAGTPQSHIFEDFHALIEIAGAEKEDLTGYNGIFQFIHDKCSHAEGAG